MFRYLHVRWGVELSSMVVFTGECGDTDYETLLGGVHKTVILKGVGIEAQKLHVNRNYPLDHVLPFENDSIAKTESCDDTSIKSSLEKLGVLESRRFNAAQ